MSRNRRKMGGQPGNTNAVKHGGYLKKFDGRTREAKALELIKADLTSALGDPSIQEVVLVELVSMKILRASLMAAELLNNPKASASVSQDFLRWSREIRSDLQALGLQRRAKDIPTLNSYIAETYGGQKETRK